MHKEAKNLNEHTRGSNTVEFVTCCFTSVGLYLSFEPNLAVFDLHKLHRTLICLPHLCNGNVTEIGAFGQPNHVHLLSITAHIY